MLTAHRGPKCAVAESALVKLLFHVAVFVLMVSSWLDRTLRPRLAFPRDPRQLAERQRWCLDIWTAAGGLPKGATIEGFSVEPFKTSAAFRSQCAQVTIGYRDAAGDRRDAHVVAKFAPKANHLRDHAIFVLQGNHHKEIGVYRQLAGDRHVPLPRCYFAAEHPSGNLCLLMERVAGAIEVTERQGCPAEKCDLVVEAMAELHAAFWQRDRDPRTAFLTVVPNAVIDFLAEQFVGPDRALFGQLLRTVWRHDGQAPTTVLHGDARVGNLLFPPDHSAGRLVFIDWQAARKGKGVFDLAYFLVLSVEPAVRRVHAERLLDRYHAALLRQGVQDYSRQTLGDDYRFACLLTLAFVSLPLLSAESSRTSHNQAGLRELGEVWTQRMAALVDDLDFAWMAAHTDLDAAALQAAFRRSQGRASSHAHSPA